MQAIMTVIAAKRAIENLKYKYHHQIIQEY